MYLVGTVMEIEKVYENNSYYGTVLLVNDVDGYQWYMRVEVDKPMYDAFKQQFTGKAGYIFGTNAGYSGVTNRPMMDVIMIAPVGEIPADMAIYHTGMASNNALADAAAAAQAENPAPQTDAANRSGRNNTTPTPTPTPEPSEPGNELSKTTDKYVLNQDTKKIHIPSCSEVKKMTKDNSATTNMTIEELEADGYTKCEHCLAN